MKNITIAIVTIIITITIAIIATIIILRESEGELLDNSGMSISYCEGTAHSLPLVGSPRFADADDDSSDADDDASDADVTAFKDETANSL